MKTIDDFYNQFERDVIELWPDESVAAIQEKVSSETILQYLRRDRVRVTKLVNLIGPMAKGKSVLDFGCAYGFYDIILKENFGCDVTGIDMDESLDAYSRLLKRHNIPVIPYTLSKQKSPVDDETFDVVIFSEILEHLRISPLRALREVWRVLKPGGTLFLTTPNIGYLRNVIHLLTGKNILQPFPEDDEDWDNVTDAITHTRVYVMDEVKHLARKAGFEIRHAGYLSAEGLDLTIRTTLLLHLAYIFFITVIPSFRDGLLLIGQKK